MAGVGVSEFWLHLIEGAHTISPYFTGSRRVFSRASAGHKRKSLVKICEVTPPKRPSILGPLELGEPIDPRLDGFSMQGRLSLLEMARLWTRLADGQEATSGFDRT